MNENDKKILEYLTSKDKIAFVAIASDLSISSEIIDAHLSPTSFLLKKDYVRIEWPAGSQKFTYITERGRKALWSCKKLIINYFSENWLTVIGTAAAIIAAITGIISISK